MKKCKHVWKHYDEDFVIQFNYPFPLPHPVKHSDTIKLYFRICEKCMLKQKQNPYISDNWEESGYNKEEGREAKLRQILKGNT